MLLKNRKSNTILGSFKKECGLVLLFFMYIIYSTAYSQSRHIVVDSKDRTPVDFAAVICSNGNSIYTDSEGYFSMTYQAKDTLYLSRVGYKQFVLRCLFLKDTIFIESTNVLPEIVIKEKAKHSSTLWLGYLDKKNKGIYHPGNQAALRIENPYGSPKQIKRVRFTFSKIKFDFSGNRNRVKSLAYIVRLRIYAIGSNGGPGQDLLQENSTSEIGRYQRLIDFVVDSKNIYLPPEGCFVAIEFIGFVDEDKKFTSSTKKGKEAFIQFAILFVSQTGGKAQSWDKKDINAPWKIWSNMGSYQPNFKFGVEIESN